jgi:phospholipid/cholesterol/gamma-HCH transport system ATP-binding protein
MNAMASMGTNEKLIAVNKLRVAFGKAVILENLDLDVYRGDILGILGASGCGKSVLLKTIIGLIKPDAGSVQVFGEDLAGMEPLRSLKLQRRWGVVFQEGGLFSSLSVGDNIRRVIEEHVRLPQRLLTEIVETKIRMVGLDPKVSEQIPDELSGGMRKKASLARALALDPMILFLDAPTANLDPVAAASFDELLLKLHDVFGMTMVVITYDLDTLHAICNRVAVIADKRLIAIGSLDAVARNDHPFIRAIFHGPRGQAAAGRGARHSQQG